MLYKKYHRSYVRQFKRGVKFRFNGSRANEPILSVVFNPFIGICISHVGHRYWGYNVSINVAVGADICIIEPDGKLSNKISIVNDDDNVPVPETEKISKLCCIKNIIKNTLVSLRKVLSLGIEILDQRLLR